MTHRTPLSTAVARPPARGLATAWARSFGSVLMLLVLAGCSESGTPAATSGSSTDAESTTASSASTEPAPAPTVLVGSGPHRMVVADGVVDPNRSR